MEDPRYIWIANTWGCSVVERFMGTEEVILSNLTEWQARAICAILNKGR